MVVSERDTIVPSNEIAQPLQAFLSQINPTIEAFSCSAAQIEALDRKFLGSGSLIEEAAINYIDNLRPNERFSKASQRLQKITTRNLTSQMSRKFLELTRTNNLPEEPREANRTPGIMAVNLRVTGELKTFNERIDILFEQYEDSVRPLLTENRLARKQAEGLLSSWLQSDWDNLFYLSQIPEGEHADDILAFLRESLETVDESNLVIRQREVERPNPDRLAAFFDSLATGHYKGKGDRHWPLLEVFLPLPSEQISALYSGNESPQTRQQVLFSSVTKMFEVGEKNLPPTLKERYASFLVNLQGETLRRLREKVSKAKNRSLALPIIDWQKFSEMEKNEPKEATTTRSEEETPIPELPKQSKLILIDDLEIADEKSIVPALENFFRDHNVREYRGTDLTTYGLILAKLAGMRANAPNFKLEKMKGIKKVESMDGQSTPVQILRLVSPVPARLMIAQFKTSVVILDAFNRDDDQKYNQIIKLGGFGTVHLPS